MEFIFHFPVEVDFRRLMSGERSKLHIHVLSIHFASASRAN